MTTFRKYNLTLGWLAFLVSMIFYGLTVEPTVSFWDCGEFIRCTQMEIGHPPGAPFYLMLARVIAIFSPNVESYALFVNYTSVLSSAGAVLFLYWTIVLLAKRFINKEDTQYSLVDYITVFGAGFIGAMTFAVTDSFWFSAVEAEVYSLSMFFTAVVIWAIFEWEKHANTDHGNRWLILIFYLIGLSISVHLLNLLVIPTIALVYYFKKYTPTFKGALISLAIGGVILGVVLFFFVLKVLSVAALLELFFVNTLGLGFNTGLALFFVLLSVLLGWGIYVTHKNGDALKNTILLCVLFVILGIMPYTMVIVRSSAHPPLNENMPDNVFALNSYLNREQYGSTPLFNGPNYNTPIIDQTEGSPNHIRLDDKYKFIGNYPPEEVYAPEAMVMFPRMFSRQNRHQQGYAYWVGQEGMNDKQGTFVAPNGQKTNFATASQGSNFEFLWKYQIRHMYVRYFMWNFVGRQNDEQSMYGHPHEGNWQSGISFVDNMFHEDQSKVPDLYKENRATNHYYFLPLLLGLLGIVALYMRGQKGRKDLIITALLFFSTGLAIILYLNQVPFQPRERDYAFVGSFYAFAIWIGLGFIAISQFLQQRVPGGARVICVSIAALVCYVAVPLNMTVQNWDDHDRSNRYGARALGKNYLAFLERNAILLTFGDNDTFPLWYMQGIERLRTDVRICNMMLFSAGWHIDEMQRRTWADAEPVKMTMKPEFYKGDQNMYTPILTMTEKPLSVKTVIEYATNPKYKQKTNQGEINVIPTRKVYLPVDKEKLLANGTISAAEFPFVEDTLFWTLPGNGLYKNSLALLDVIANFDWDRSIYVGAGYNPRDLLNLHEYFRNEGIVSRFVPIKQNQQTVRLNTDRIYSRLMNDYEFGNLNAPDYYVDHTTKISYFYVMGLRKMYVQTAQALLIQNRTDSAKKILEKCLEVVPAWTKPYSGLSGYGISTSDFQLGLLCLQVGLKEEGEKIYTDCVNNMNQHIEYFKNLGDIGFQLEETYKQALNQALNNLIFNNQSELSQKLRSLPNNLNLNPSETNRDSQ